MSSCISRYVCTSVLWRLFIAEWSMRGCTRNIAVMSQCMPRWYSYSFLRSSLLNSSWCSGANDTSSPTRWTAVICYWSRQFTALCYASNGLLNATNWLALIVDIPFSISSGVACSHMNVGGGIVFVVLNSMFSLCSLYADIDTDRHVVNTSSTVGEVLLVEVHHGLDNLLHHHGLCLIQGYTQTHRRHNTEV